MSRANTTQFETFIEDTEAGYNETKHSSLLGSPDDVEGDSEKAKIAKFQLMKDNTLKFENNNEIANRNIDAIKEAGQFRVEKKRETFDIGHSSRHTKMRSEL